MYSTISEPPRGIILSILRRARAVSVTSVRRRPEDASRAGQGGEGVKIGTQHGGDLGQEHVAGHPSADPGHDAEKRRHDGIEPESERLFRASNREESQPRGVEKEHRAAHPVDGGGPPEGEGSNEQRNRQITPVADRRRRHCADHQVASDAPGITRRKRQDQNPEQIEPVLDPRRRTAQREDKGTDEIEHQ
jgi:hypothetical protein